MFPQFVVGLAEDQLKDRSPHRSVVLVDHPIEAGHDPCGHLVNLVDGPFCHPGAHSNRVRRGAEGRCALNGPPASDWDGVHAISKAGDPTAPPPGPTETGSDAPQPPAADPEAVTAAGSRASTSSE